MPGLRSTMLQSLQLDDGKKALETSFRSVDHMLLEMAFHAAKDGNILALETFGKWDQDAGRWMRIVASIIQHGQYDAMVWFLNQNVIIQIPLIVLIEWTTLAIRPDNSPLTDSTWKIVRMLQQMTGGNMFLPFHHCHPQKVSWYRNAKESWCLEQFENLHKHKLILPTPLVEIQAWLDPRPFHDKEAIITWLQKNDLVQRPSLIVVEDVPLIST